MWLTYETRLSGVTVIVVAFLTHAVAFISQSKDRKQYIFANIYPYLIALVLIIVSERLIFAPATSNLSDINNNADYLAHIKYYFELLVLYFEGLFGNGYVILVLFALGLIIYGFKKENIFYTLFIIGTMIVNISLPYTRGCVMYITYSRLSICIAFTV